MTSSIDSYIISPTNQFTKKKTKKNKKTRKTWGNTSSNLFRHLHRHSLVLPAINPDQPSAPTCQTQPWISRSRRRNGRSAVTSDKATLKYRYPYQLCRCRSQKPKSKSKSESECARMALWGEMVGKLVSGMNIWGRRKGRNFWQRGEELPQPIFYF